MGDSSKKYICFNCKDSSSRNKMMNGWKDSAGHYVKLCFNCCSIYKGGQFCEMFHSDEDGWRDCESCKQLIHCGCIVSLSDYMINDSGGITCNDCSDTKSLLGQDCSNDESHSTDVTDHVNDTDPNPVLTPLFEKVVSVVPKCSDLCVQQVMESSQYVEVDDQYVQMDVQTNENIGNRDSNNTEKTKIIDRHKHQDNAFNNYQKSLKGKKKGAHEAREDYNKLTAEEKKAFAGKKATVDSSDYRVIADMDRFVKLIRMIPANNIAKLTESPFKHFLDLTNEKMQLNYICVTLSHNFDDNKLQLDGEVLDVTEDRFWELMKIKKMDPIVGEMNIDVAVKDKFVSGNEISMTKVKNVLFNADESVDDVNRAFALLAMHTVICPPKRSLFHQRMLGHVNDVNAIKNQDWASLALSSISKGKHVGKGDGKGDGESKTWTVGGSVFFLQLCLMRKLDEGLDLLAIDEGKIQEFSQKWAQNYSRLSASIGYSQPLVNKILRNTVDFCSILRDKKRPVTMESLLVIDETMEKFLSEVAAMESQQEIQEENAGSASGVGDDVAVLQDDVADAVPRKRGRASKKTTGPATNKKTGPAGEENVVRGVKTRSQAARHPS